MKIISLLGRIATVTPMPGPNKRFRVQVESWDLELRTGASSDLERTLASYLLSLGLPFS